MLLIDQLRSARHVFASHRARTLLTLVGIMLGSGSIVLLSSLLRGGEAALLETNQRANEADLIQVRRDEPPPDQIRRTRRDLSHPDAEYLGQSPLLAGAAATSEQSRDARALWRDRKKRVRLVAVTPIAQSLNRLTVERGRFIDDEDLAGRRRVCVVGHDVWHDLLEDRPDLDEISVEIAGTRWTVVGALRAKPPLGGGGDGLWMWDRKVLVPRTTYDSFFDPRHGANRIYVRLLGLEQLSSHLAAVERVVKSTLLRRHLGVRNFKVEGEEGAANQGRLILDIVKLLLLGTALLSLVVGGINIMNIMLVTVAERTREIGLRRAIGATPGAILVQFLLESGLIALAGGVVGVAGGAGLGWLVAAILRSLLGSWELRFETWAFTLGLGLSVVTGVVFGLFPAWRAARMDPVEALRRE